MASVEPGMVIGGRYRLERPLAQGGMGALWVAWHLQLDTAVALKFMDPTTLDSAVARLRFEREAKASAQLKHPNAIQVYDYGLDAETPYIAMELLEGEDLSARITREGRLPISEVARVLGEACKALQRAHEIGLVHRDLKPSNLFLVRQGAEETTKLLDFGIAKSIKPQPSGRATATGTLVGSPLYMSPEQVRNTKALDHRSDLWSLGVIAFECLTGEPPFLNEEIGDLLVAICSDPLPVPSRLIAGLGPEVDLFFERALARDPDKRFPSARAFAEALDALASAAPAAGRAPLGGSPRGGSPRVDALGATTPAELVVAPRGAVASSSASTLAPSDANLPPTQARSGARRGLAAGAVVALSLAACAGYLLLRGSAEPAASAGASAPAEPPRMEPASPVTTAPVTTAQGAAAQGAAAVDTAAASVTAPTVVASTALPSATASATARVSAKAAPGKPQKAPRPAASPAAPAAPAAVEAPRPPPVVPLHGRD